MIRIIVLLIIFFPTNISFAQTKYEVDSLLSEIGKVENSKHITKNISAIKLISYGDKSLGLLASCFGDTNQTNIRSECHDTFLSKGELAIIIADRIELMPYALLTGVQNCLLEFCKDNLNWVEYYIPFIQRNGVHTFTKKYTDWLVNTDRKKWAKNVGKKKKRIQP